MMLSVNLLSPLVCDMIRLRVSGGFPWHTLEYFGMWHIFFRDFPYSKVFQSIPKYTKVFQSIPKFFIIKAEMKKYDTKIY